MAKVVLTDEAKEDIRDLERSNQKKVLRKLKELETEPEKRGQPLGNRSGGNLTGLRKLVVGDRHLRVIFGIEDGGETAVVWVIRERADDRCYELALARVQMHESDPVLLDNFRRFVAAARGSHHTDDT